MVALKRSLSFHRKKPKLRQHQCMSDPIEAHAAQGNFSDQQASIDQLVIPHRIRYPSDKIHSAAAPEPDPIVKAEHLLRLSEERRHDTGEADHRNSGLRRSLSENLLSLPGPFDGSSSTPFLTPPAARTLSRNVSGHSSSGFSTLSTLVSSGGSCAPVRHDAQGFLESYNRLASEHNLPPMVSVDEMPSPTKSKRQKGWFMSRLTKSSSSKNLQETACTGLARKPSIGSFLTRRPKNTLAGRSLDTMYRLGGFSMLTLPASHGSIELLIPLPIAATAQYLLRHGDIGGIFRKSGSTAAVNALYEHYAFPAKDISASEPTHVEMTIGTTSLPADVPVDPHDVASAFKKFLWDVPGGILGSVALFKALEAISFMSLSDGRRVRLIALAILSVKSSRRFDLIQAVLGLLSSLKRTNGPLELPSVFSIGVSCGEQMTPRAFGVVFAPLLLGELAQSIEFGNERSHSPKKSIFHLPKSRPLSSLDRDLALGAEKERITACSSVMEMLITDWDDVARQMHFLETVLHKPLPMPRIRFKENRPLESMQQTSPLSHISESSKSAQSTAKFSMLYNHTVAQQGAQVDQAPTPAPDGCVPMVSRSASVAGVSHVTSSPLFDHSRPLVHSATAIDLRVAPRWSSPQPTYRTQHASSATHLPWWEREMPPHETLSLLTVRPGSMPIFVDTNAAHPLEEESHAGQIPIVQPEMPQLESLHADRRATFAQDTRSSLPLPLDGTSTGQQEVPLIHHGHCNLLPARVSATTHARADARKSSHNSSEGSSRYGSQKLKVSALYDEILKLQHQLHVKDEELRELRIHKECGSQQIRQSALVQAQPEIEEMKREVEWWKAKAQRAEATVRSCTRHDSANAIRMRWKRADSELD